MKEKFKKIWAENQKFRKFIGIILIVIGGLSIITPFTPVGFLLIIGLEMAGIRFLFWDKIKDRFKS